MILEKRCRNITQRLKLANVNGTVEPYDTFGDNIVALKNEHGVMICICRVDQMDNYIGGIISHANGEMQRDNF